MNDGYQPPSMRRQRESLPTFGDRHAGSEYQSRPCVYAVMLDASGCVAVVRTVTGRHFLPGGGIEPGESPEAALMREAREECGSGIRITGTIGQAVQYVDAGDEGRFANHSTFYRGQFEAPYALIARHADEVLWLTPGEAERRLHQRSHAWAVETALGMIRPPR